MRAALDARRAAEAVRALIPEPESGWAGEAVGEAVGEVVGEVGGVAAEAAQDSDSEPLHDYQGPTSHSSR